MRNATSNKTLEKNQSVGSHVVANYTNSLSLWFVMWFFYAKSIDLFQSDARCLQMPADVCLILDKPRKPRHKMEDT